MFCKRRFIDDAYKEGIPVVVLTTYSKSGDQIARSIVEKLGEERISKLRIVRDKEVEQSLYTQLVNYTGLLSGVDEQLAKEAIKAVSAVKQRIAEEVASMLRLSVDIDTSRSKSLEKIIAALRAGAEVAGLPVCDCVLITGSQSSVAGAERVGMPCVTCTFCVKLKHARPSPAYKELQLHDAILLKSKMLSDKVEWCAPVTNVWSQMIRGHAWSETPRKSVEFYKRLVGLEAEADGFSYSFVLSACARSGLIEGEQVHKRVLVSGFGSGVEYARLVFDGMRERSVASWNSLRMVSGC